MIKEIKIGQKFFFLTVIERLPKENPNADTMYRCKCECGEIKDVAHRKLNAGRTKSCGNLKLHYGRYGKKKVDGYSSWKAMKGRCFDKNLECYPNYGGRGISICEEWIDNFEAFIEHIGPRPSPRHSVDRINNEGNYEPGNVKWSTPAEQNRNRRKNFTKVSDFI